MSIRGDYYVDKLYKEGKLKVFGGVIALLLGLLMFVFIFINKASIDDLYSIQGEFVSLRSAEVGGGYRSSKHKTIFIRLKNYPNTEFDIGRNYPIEKLREITSDLSKPIIIELIGRKDSIISKVTRANFGLKINDLTVISIEDGLRENEKLQIQTCIYSFILFSIGLCLIYFGSKQINVNRW